MLLCTPMPLIDCNYLASAASTGLHFNHRIIEQLEMQKVAGWPRVPSIIKIKYKHFSGDYELALGRTSEFQYNDYFKL